MTQPAQSERKKKKKSQEKPQQHNKTIETIKIKETQKEYYVVLQIVDQFLVVADKRKSKSVPHSAHPNVRYDSSRSRLEVVVARAHNGFRDPRWVGVQGCGWTGGLGQVLGW